MKLKPDGVEWGGPDNDWWYFYWWNWLPKKLRYFGRDDIWYDGPHASFGFWFINWSWSTPWTRIPDWARAKPKKPTKSPD